MPDDEAKSFADVVTSLLNDWGTFVRFLLLIIALCVIAWCFTWGVLRTTPRGTSQISLGPNGILVTQTTKEGAEYLVEIYPQGWQETAIQVAEGDTLNFEARGNVQIDLEGLVESVEERLKAEDRVIEHEKKIGRWEQEKDSFRSERYFTDQEKMLSRLQWNWTDPNGNPETNAQANPPRRGQSILPDRNYGALLGAIRETQAEPTRADAFFIGKNNTIKATRSGKLYFTVNDVWDDADPNFPEKFFVDNIGSFYAKVTVAPRK